MRTPLYNRNSAARDVLAVVMPDYVPLVIDRILHFVMNLDDTDTSSAAASGTVLG